MERHVPELYDWAQKNNGAAPEMRCAILDVVSWFPGVLQQLWIDVSVRCPQNDTTKVRRNLEWLQLLGKRRKRSFGIAVRALVFETYGRLGGEGTKLLL